MSKEEVAIRVEHVEKRFKVYYDKGYSLKERVLFRKRNRYEHREVLKDISFMAKRGEAIGLIGQNGCGKSTMLKLLTRIMYPDNGNIEMNGRASALIELGAGFHPDMSGRENIYTNAAIFGLTKKEIDERLQTIIDFSELGEYIDNPVRTYSSGMYMRLAFSVAINVDADILLIDEILAVGDAAFQAKCFNKLREVKAKGTTIVIVSHALGQIEQLCDRSIWIRDGKVCADGAPHDIHPMYLDYMSKQTVLTSSEKKEEQQPQQEADTSGEQSETAQEFSENKNRWGNGAVRITDIKLYNEREIETDRFLTGEPMLIEMKYKVYELVDDVVCGIGIFRNDGIHCYGTNTQIDQINNIKLGDSGKIICRVESIELLQGEYMLDVAIHASDGFAYDYYHFAKTFCTYSTKQEIGVIRLEHAWEFVPNK